MSGSSSTTSRSGAGCGCVTDAPEESALEARLAVARAQLGRAAAEAQAPALEPELLGERRRAPRVVGGAAERQHGAQELRAGEIRRRLEALGQVGEMPAARGVARRLAEDADRAGVARGQVEQAADQRGLAGAVRTDQA